MTDHDYVLFPFVLLVSASLTWFVRRNALARGMLDHPNARSSHTLPTPRGGGLSIVIAATIGVGVLWYRQIADTPLAFALLGGGSAVALIGYIDDRRSLPVLARIAVHFSSAIWAVCTLGGLPAVQWGAGVVDLGMAGDVLTVLGIVWMLNLINFMDGIDGIAASEAVFVAGTGAALALLGGMSASVPTTALLIATASLGFLFWNWPPAKIFMGDVGSGYLGYVIAVLALAAARESAVALYVWLILGGVFFVDATVTLVRRLVRRERVYEAHRSHAYQWLARRWKSHRRVTIAVLMVNLIWLFPCALLATLYPAAAGWLVLAALIPIVIAALVSGAGRLEVKADQERS